MSKNINLPIIQSLQTGIELINKLVKQNQPLKFTDIERLTTMSKSSLHKYLNTLTNEGILFRNTEGTYYLGSKLIEFGNAAIGSVNLVDMSGPYLKEISQKVNLTTLLQVWTNSGPVIANIWSTHLGLNIGAEIGTKLPALSSAGKIYLAFGDENVIEEWQNKELKNLTIEQQNKLKKEVIEVKESKFAYAAEPIIEHISSFSVPILNYDNKINGCVTVVGFNTQIPKSVNSKISLEVQDKVLKISQNFGYYTK